jgi:hypothetical protein
MLGLCLRVKEGSGMVTKVKQKDELLVVSVSSSNTEDLLSLV